MTKHKVEYKVWVTTENRYGVITRIYDDAQKISFVEINNRHSYSIHLIHDTADTMLIRLGFEKALEDSSYIIYHKINSDNGVMTEIRFEKEKLRFKATNYTKNNKMFSAYIDQPLQNALSQLMVELEARNSK